VRRGRRREAVGSLLLASVDVGRPLSILAVAALAAAFLPVRAEAGAETEVAAPCLEQPVVTIYMHRLQDRVLDVWDVPPDTLGNREVTLGFELAKNGALVESHVMSATDERLAHSVRAAFVASAPFDPIPDEASCLVGRRLALLFQNQY
jgi:hypothetical protein